MCEMAGTQVMLNGLHMLPFWCQTTVILTQHCMYQLCSHACVGILAKSESLVSVCC